MITTITWINTNHDQIWLLKEESDPMRGRWSASNFSWTRGGGGRDTSSSGHFLSGGFTPLILTCYICIAFLLYGGVASPNLIFVQTIAVSTEAKLWFCIAAAGNHLETAPASIVCPSCMTRARVWRHQHCPPTWQSAGCDRKYVNVHVRFTIAGEEGARSRQ